MTSVKFLTDEKRVYGFSISGHSTIDCDDETGKIVCSAVSSAAYMAANTITDIIGDKADIIVNDGEMTLSVKNPTDKTQAVLEGLRLHLTELSGMYSNNLRINGGARYVKD